jgi:ribosome-associated protein YbcJ (S4-like RNA binding protein)
MRGCHENSRVLSVALLGLVILVPACTHRKTVQVGTHKVTVARHGFEKRLRVIDQSSMPTLEYAGLSTDGKGMKVTIRGDSIKVNDKETGKLRPGDSVLIGDEGIAVNELDYGETEKYLRANTVGETTAQNQ